MSLPEPREPLFFQRVAQAAVWGGRSVAERLGVLPADGTPIGETWELSDHPAQPTELRGGAYDGASLQELLAAHRDAVMGESALDPHGRFPLLVKFIDAQQDLSVQVHPPDGVGSPTGIGKTEAWFFLEECRSDAKVIAGLQEGFSSEALCALGDRPEMVEHLRQLPVRGGDAMMIPAGTVHAIRAGAVLCEVQQTSDVTFRLHDWGRVGLDGQPRPLHLAQARAVIHAASRPEVVRAAFPPPPNASPTVETALLLECPYFRLHQVRVHDRADHDPQGFARVLVVVSGKGSMVSPHGGRRPLSFGDTILLPARMGRLTVEAESDGLDLLEAVAL